MWDKDAFNPHFVKVRFVATGEWTALSALHTGGDTPFDQNADMSLARDAGGQLYIPGSSIIGALRSYLARHSAASFQDFENEKESNSLAALFGRLGGERRNQDRLKLASYASQLRAGEARVLDPKPPRIRDNVRMDGANGTALDKAKFNMEVLPEGARFGLELSLVLYDEPAGAVTGEQVLACFRQALESFHGDGIRLGGRTGQGLGRGKVEKWSIRRFDMTNKVHALDWLRYSGASGGESCTLELLGGGSLQSKRQVLNIQAGLHVKTSLLIRSGADSGSAPDSVHLTENGRQLVSGSSLRGILRHRCERIARALRLKADAVDSLFGKAGEGVKTPYAGRIRVNECALSNGDLRVQSRVAIDRFTGSAQDAHLFDEAPFWPSDSAKENLNLQIEVMQPKAHEVLLVLEALKDLWTGDLTIGGGAGVGRGVCQGIRATVTWTGLPPLTWDEKGKVEGWNQEWESRYQEGVNHRA